MRIKPRRKRFKPHARLCGRARITAQPLCAWLRSPRTRLRKPARPVHRAQALQALRASAPSRGARVLTLAHALSGASGRNKYATRHVLDLNREIDMQGRETIIAIIVVLVIAGAAAFFYTRSAGNQDNQTQPSPHALDQTE
jgi:hypothetical protein